MPDSAHRRAAARLALEALEDTNYALAGASALIEHGLIPRETVDIDLFTTVQETVALALILERLRTAFAENGGSVDVKEEYDQFAKVLFHLDGAAVEGDLGTDWRGHTPVATPIGATLDERDAVGNKISALYSRSLPRDFMDVGAIASMHRWTLEDLLDLGQHVEPTMDLDFLAQALAHGVDLPATEFRRAGLSDNDEATIRRGLDDFRSFVNRQLPSSSPHHMTPPHTSLTMRNPGFPGNDGPPTGPRSA